MGHQNENCLRNANRIAKIVTSHYWPISNYELAKSSFRQRPEDSRVGRPNTSFSKDFVDFQNDSSQSSWV